MHAANEQEKQKTLAVALRPRSLPEGVPQKMAKRVQVMLDFVEAEVTSSAVRPKTKHQGSMEKEAAIIPVEVQGFGPPGRAFPDEGTTERQ